MTMEYSLIEGISFSNPTTNLGDDTDPLFTDAGNGNYRIQIMSPCYNNGSNTYAAEKDLDNNPRICNGIIDMGAYEYTINPNNGIVYVKKDVSGGKQDGSSWANAVPELAMVLYYAANNDSLGIQQIWVAAGSYAPMFAADGISIDEKDNAFVLDDMGIQLYGGFPADANDMQHTSIYSRDWSKNPTILTANMNSGDTAYHVVIVTGGNHTAYLNGFTISGGNACGNGYITLNGQNIHRDYGGGIYLSFSNGSFFNLTIGGNSASKGGAVFNDKSQAYFSNGLIVQNNSNNQDGCIYNQESSLFLYNTTLTMSLPHGIGVYNDEGDSYLDFCNSIIWSGNLLNSSQAIIDNGNNSNFSHCLIQGVTFNPHGDMLNGNLNPMFANTVNSVDYPNNPGNYRLCPSSPCRDQGNNNYANTNNLLVDLDMNPRIRGQHIDLGAYEHLYIEPDVNGIVYVKKNTSSSDVDDIQNGSSWESAVSELAPALYDAHLSSNIQQIWVAAGDYAPMYPADDYSTNEKDKAFVLNTNIEVYGGFPANADDIQHTSLSSRDWRTNPAVLTGNLYSGDTAHHVIIATGDHFILDGFWIKDGYANDTSSIMVNGYNIFQNNGGGIYTCSNENFKLQNMLIQDNYADMYGGGIYAHNSPSFEIIDVSIINNQAYSGGGFYKLNSDITMYDSRICGNKASICGSGLYSIIGSSNLYNVLMAQNEIIGINKGGSTSLEITGGSIYNKQSDGNYNHLTIAMCIPNGVGIYNVNNSNMEINNSIIWTDQAYTGNITSVFADNSCNIQYNYSLTQGISPGGSNLSRNDNPDFVSAEYNSDYWNNPGNYHLESGSLCVNYGNPIYALSNFDLDGNPRINRPDLGVYEYNPNNPNPTNKPHHKNMGDENIISQESIFQSNISLYVYPNPTLNGTQTKLFLGENNFYYKKPVQIKLYSLDGKLLHNRKYSNGNITLNGPRLSAGMYIINAQTQDGKKYTTKLVVTQ